MQATHRLQCFGQRLVPIRDPLAQREIGGWDEVGGIHPQEAVGGRLGRRDDVLVAWGDVFGEIELCGDPASALDRPAHAIGLQPTADADQSQVLEFARQTTACPRPVDRKRLDRLATLAKRQFGQRLVWVTRRFRLGRGERDGRRGWALNRGGRWGRNLWRGKRRGGRGCWSRGCGSRGRVGAERESTGKLAEGLPLRTKPESRIRTSPSRVGARSARAAAPEWTREAKRPQRPAIRRESHAPKMKLEP